MIVKVQRPIRLVNACGAKYEEGLVTRGILKFTDEPVAQTKKVFMHGNYPAVAVHHHKLHLHRLVWFAVNGGIPHDHYVHHKNHDKLDARLENLVLLPKSEHQSYHNKGKILTNEHRQRIGQANKKRKGMRYKIYENPELLK